MKKANNLIPVIALFSCSAMAQNIDVGGAATSALLTVAIRGAIAFCFFKLVTINLTRKTLYTSVRNGRWVGAWLMGVSILTYQSSYKSDADFYFGIILVSVVWFILGFVIGFVWRAFKPIKEALAQQNIVEVNDEKLWERAAVELNSDAKNEGLWIKCFAESNGDEAKAKAMYLKEAVKRLSSNTVVSYKDDKKLAEIKKPITAKKDENESFIKSPIIILLLLVPVLILVFVGLVMSGK
jgi:hypothetical protein